MDFESRFYQLFRDESEFPAPHRISIKRRKSFSEKFFRSASGSTLKLPGKNALKIRQKFMFREKSSSKERLFHNDKEVCDDKTLSYVTSTGDFEPPSLSSSRSLSGSVECLPISESVNSYLPVSTHSSVITLPKFKMLKIPSHNKFGTFKRSDACASPYGSILKGRINRSRLELKGIEFNEFDPSCHSSPVSYTLPLSPFLDSSFSSTNSVKVDSFTESKTNFYGQETDKNSLARTVYSRRVSPIYGKNVKDNLSTLRILDVECQSKLCKQIENPKIVNGSNPFKKNSFKDLSSSFEDSFQDDSSVRENQIRNLNPYNDSKVINEFHQELLSKCSKFKANIVCLPTKQQKLMVSVKSEDQAELDVAGKIGQPEQEVTSKRNSLIKSNIPSKLDISSEQGVPYKPGVPPKPDVSIKPEISPKPDILIKPEISPKPDTLIKPEILSKPDIPIKPDIYIKSDVSPKPDIPVKPERLKIEKSVLPTLIKVLDAKTIPEINNNCIILNKSCPSNVGINKVFHFPTVDESNPLFCQNKNETKQNGDHAELSNQTENQKSTETNKNNDFKSNKMLPTFSSSSTLTIKNCEPYQTLKVRDLVASFNHVLSNSNEIHAINNNSDKFANAQTHPYTPENVKHTISKKSLSEWNLTNSDNSTKLNAGEGKYKSFSENLGQKPFGNFKIPQMVQVSRVKSFRVKI